MDEESVVSEDASARSSFQRFDAQSNTTRVHQVTPEYREYKSPAGQRRNLVLPEDRRDIPRIRNPPN